MGEQLSEANRALIERVLSSIVGSAIVRDMISSFPGMFGRLLDAARSEGPHPESGERADWAARHNVMRRAIADGFSNGNEQYDEASEAQRMRYDAAANAALAASPPPLKGEALPVVSLGDLTDVFERPFTDPEDPRLKCAQVLTVMEATAVLEFRGDLAAALSLPRPASDKGEEAPVCWVSPEQLAAHADPVPETGGGHYLPTRKTKLGNFTQPLYARPSPGVSREEVARIVDPLPWSDNWSNMPTTREARKSASLEKADAILALLSRGEA